VIDLKMHGENMKLIWWWCYDGDKGEAMCNKCKFGLMKHFSSKLLSSEVKCLIYKTPISPVLTYW